jgi:hypothetical protein
VVPRPFSFHHFSVPYRPVPLELPVLFPLLLDPDVLPELLDPALLPEVPKRPLLEPLLEEPLLFAGVLVPPDCEASTS